MLRVVRGLSLPLVLVVLSRCASSPTSAGGDFTGKMSLIYQGGRAAVTEPCGCQSTPYGGMDREHNAVQAIRSEDKAALFVDAGNGLAPDKMPAKVETYREKARLVVEMMNKNTVQAYSPGPFDLKLGVPFLKEMEKKASFPFINASLRNAQGEPLFTPSTVIDVQGLKVGIIGLSPEGKGKDWTAIDREQALKEALSQISGKAHWIVVLSQLPSRENEKLAEKHAEVQIIVGCDLRSTLSEPFFYNHGKTILLDPHVYGYRLGKMEALVKLPFKGFYSPLAIHSSLQELEGWKKQIAEKKRMTEAKANIERIQENKILAPIPGGTEMANALIGLSESEYGKPNELTDMLKQYKQKLKAQAIK